MKEFKRILKDNGMLVLLWNRRSDDIIFMKGYEDIIKKYNKDYTEVNHKRVSDEIIKKLYSRDYKKTVFPNYQEFDFNGLIGRMASSSYSLSENDENYNELISELKSLYNRFEKNGKIRFEYRTEMCTGYI